ncbi:hypothetical protein ACN9KM_18845 [Kocuria sp. CPCC 205274]|uniref:hypothetical protein n=1 Tax=Herbiconiux daphne TaxID=2970914 RepID=UPI0038B36033
MSILRQNSHKVFRACPPNTKHTIRDIAWNVSTSILSVLNRCYILNRVIAHNGSEVSTRRCKVNILS